MNFFGKNLRYLREKNTLTQEEIAQLFGLKNSTWSNYENGVSEPSISGLLHISNFFGIMVDELLRADIALQEGHAVKQRRHKRYVMNDATAIVEEQSPALYFLTKELKKLRKDVDTMKELYDQQQTS